MDLANVAASEADREQWLGDETGEQFHEVAPAERRLALAAEPEESAVVLEDPPRKHVIEHRPDRGLRHARKRRHPPEPGRPVSGPDTALLEGERHDLLRKNVKGLRRRRNGLDVSV